MIAPKVAIVVVSVTKIVVSVMSNVAINMITIVVTNVSINKVLLQFNFEGRKRRAVLYSCISLGILFQSLGPYTLIIFPPYFTK